MHAFFLSPLSYLNPRVFLFEEIIYILNTGSEIFIISFLFYCLSEQLRLIPQLHYWTGFGLIKIFIFFIVCHTLLALFIIIIFSEVHPQVIFFLRRMRWHAFQVFSLRKMVFFYLHGYCDVLFQLWGCGPLPQVCLVLPHLCLAFRIVSATPGFPPSLPSSAPAGGSWRLSPCFCTENPQVWVRGQHPRPDAQRVSLTQRWLRLLPLSSQLWAPPPVTVAFLLCAHHCSCLSGRLSSWNSHQDFGCLQCFIRPHVSTGHRSRVAVFSLCSRFLGPPFVCLCVALSCLEVTCLQSSLNLLLLIWTPRRPQGALRSLRSRWEATSAAGWSSPTAPGVSFSPGASALQWPVGADSAGLHRPKGGPAPPGVLPGNEAESPPLLGRPQGWVPRGL